MIELNLTYEESKKILKLGYDFTEICTEWQHNFYPPNGDPSKGKIVKWFRLGEHLVNPTLIGMLTRYQVDLLKTYTIDIEEALADIENYKIGYEYTPLIPIIPKAALEACLPELSGSTWLKNLKTNWVILDLDPHIVKLESIFEAFTWCHENYPEELKKKLKEVMK